METDSTTQRELYSRYVYSGTGVQGDFSTKLAPQQHILPETSGVWIYIFIDYITQTSIYTSEAGLAVVVNNCASSQSYHTCGDSCEALGLGQVRL